MRIYLAMGLFLMGLYLSAQDLKYSPKRTTFWDHETQQPITILNDSTYVYGLDLQLKQIPKLDLDDSSLNNMAVAHIHGKTYLYDFAGGVVVEYSNQSFTRHDKSFTHKNQYYSVHFVHDNQIYLLGGYGLFTTKNILTRYDFKAREWFLVETSGDIPEFITTNVFQVIGDQLYFVNSNFKSPNLTEQIDEAVYVLDLNQFTLKKLGLLEDLNSVYSTGSDLTSYNVNSLNNHTLLLTKIDEPAKLINFKANTLSEVELSPQFHTRSKILYYNPEEQSYTIATTNSGNERLYYLTINSQDLVQKTLTTHALYKTDFKSYTELAIYIGALLAFIVFGFIGFKSYKNLNKLKINLRNKSIKLKGKHLNQLKKEEVDLLLYLAQHPNYIEFSDLMIQLGYKGNYDALKRTRKVLFNDLHDQLIPYLGDRTKALFIIKKSKDDKRYKVIKLNPDLVVIKH
ncbi:MAG: hypothetical protein KGY51_12065 [Psychroflexus sp.]|nr:hypothetical protein [Psychroflexus sp.]